MANTKISQLTPNTNPSGNEELVYALNNTNGKMTLNTMKAFASADSQATLVSGVNIRTINNQSILWSGNIDVSWGWGGSFEPTELGWDANIWELSEWVYTTTYDLYYKSGEKVPLLTSTWATNKQMLFVIAEWTGQKGYFVYNVGHRNSLVSSYACYWHSASASVWVNHQLWSWDASLKRFWNTISSISSIDPISSAGFTQVVDWISGAEDLAVNTSNAPYEWVTYTIIINSVQSWETYTVWLWTGVTNPLNLTLPTNSNKRCVITLIATSETTAIVTWCTIAN